MKGIFTLEDAFDITGRGTVITGRVQEGIVNNGDFIIIGNKTITIKGIEMFQKLFKGATKGDNVGLLLGSGYSKDELFKHRGEKLVIQDISSLRNQKLNQIGI